MPKQLLRNLANESITHTERGVVLLWWYGRQDPGRVVSAAEIAQAFEDAGYARQNVSRLASSLKKDPRTVTRADGFRLRAGAEQALEAEYGSLVGPQIPDASNSMLPAELFQATRGYIERVALQLNASYDVGLYDCTAVMARRLVETLVIEVYEHRGEGSKIRGGDGHFFMLNGLISVIGADTAIGLSRNAKRGLADLKALGDLSAHNRRFNARQSDLDSVRAGLRVVVEELIHLAGLDS